MTTQLAQISLEKAYEIRHWMAVFHVTEAELYTAVRHVGKGVDALRRHVDATFGRARLWV